MMNSVRTLPSPIVIKKCQWICILVCLQQFAFASCYYTEILPKGNIYVQHGDNLTLQCVINNMDEDSHLNAKDLEFLLGGKPLKSEAVDDNTRSLFIEEPNLGHKTYYCVSKSRKAYPTVKVVHVAAPPSDVTDFKCISRNIESLTCSWTKPKDEVIATTYELTNIVFGSEIIGCRARTLDNGTMYCYFDATTVPRYRQGEDTLYFHLKISNRMGFNEQNFMIDHYSIVKPDPILELKAVNLTPHGIDLKWHIPEHLIDFIHEGVEYKIEYQISQYNDTIHKVNTEGFKTRYTDYKLKGFVEFQLDNLPYAHKKYIVKVYVKTVKATDEFWSEPAGVEVITASEKPRRSPNLPVGAFDQNNYQGQRILYIYWKQLDPCEEAGTNFTYTLNITNELLHTRNNIGYFKLKSKSLDAMDISIRSQNEEGFSNESSYLYIPPYKDTDLKVLSLTTFVYGNGTYELLWRAVKGIDNYTLFWCIQKSPRICRDSIDYKVIKSNVNQHRMELPIGNPYQFAISANQGKRSSGMMWTKCEIPYDRIAMIDFPVTLDYVNRGKTFVNLTWSLDCLFNNGILTGYYVEYCPIIDAKTSCDYKSLYINNPKATKAFITNLYPYTTYKFKITVNTVFGLKTGNNVKLVSTLQDVPSKPRNINISNITSHSLLISLQPPLHINGPINNIEYVIYNFSLEMYRVKAKFESILLIGLQSYTNYSLSLRAHNENIDAYSDLTDPVDVRTSIGAPSMVSPSYEMQTLSWKPPDSLGGPVTLYQVRIVTDGHIDSEHETMFNTTLLELNLTTCERAAENVTYQVRAVNLDNDPFYGARAFSDNVNLTRREDNETLLYPGDWSTEIVMSCSLEYTTTSLLLIITGILLFVYFTVKFYKIIRRRNDLGKPKLPLGLYLPSETPEYICDKTDNISLIQHVDKTLHNCDKSCKLISSAYLNSRNVVITSEKEVFEKSNGLVVGNILDKTVSPLYGIPLSNAVKECVSKCVPVNSGYVKVAPSASPTIQLNTIKSLPSEYVQVGIPATNKNINTRPIKTTTDNLLQLNPSNTGTTGSIVISPLPETTQRQTSPQNINEKLMPASRGYVNPNDVMNMIKLIDVRNRGREEVDLSDGYTKFSMEK